jgi:hypothetical protein
MERQFQKTKLLLSDLYFFYHRGAPRKLGLQYRAQYIAQTAEMFDLKTEEKLHDLKCRFVDLSALEQCGTPTVQIEMDWKMLDWLKTEVLEKQKTWFKRPLMSTEVKDENGVVVSMYYIEPK